MSQEEQEQESRKRTSNRQLTDRDDVDADVQDNDSGTFRKADQTVMQQRKIFKVRGGKAHLERSSSDATPATTSPTTPRFTFGTQQEEKKEASSPAATTPVKEGTPVKEAPKEATTTPQTPTKEATPTKENTPATSSTPSKDTTTPQKESTPAKDITQSTPSKDTNGDAKGSKEATPTKPEGSEPAKPLFGFTSPNFPTSFSQAASSSFPTLTSNPFGTSSAFSSSSTGSGFSGFTGFNFPSVNFAAGSSVFNAGGAKKEGSDDEGGEGANPEEEVPITGASSLPLVQTVTGEEDETTIFSIRAKLYAMAEGKWQERGVGQLKLNKAKDGKCRLLMRDQGGKHLRLNAALFAEMKVDKSGDKSVQFVAIGSGGSEQPATPGTPVKPFTTFAARVGRKEEAEEIYDAIQKHKKDIPTHTSSTTSTSTSTTSSPISASAQPATTPEKSST